MKNILLLFLLSCIAIISQAQPFAVGHLSLNVYDDSRTGGTAINSAPDWGNTGRIIGTEIYYPAISNGDNTPAANGQFPIVVFGHGFVMTYDAYNTLYEFLAQQGFIVALPITEGGFSPVHADFGADMAFLANQLPLLNANNIVPILQNHVLPKAAIGGHSMGAGCSMVGAQSNTNLYALFNMATATSNTTGISSLAGANTIVTPTLILSGERDCVADTSVQIQHYDACGAPLKYLAILKDLTHCDFGNGTSFTCTFGQNSSGCANTIPNNDANNAVLHYLLPFLQRTLKNDCVAADSFMQRINVNKAFTVNTKNQGDLRCFPTALNNTLNEGIQVYPNPASSYWRIENKDNNNTSYRIVNTYGQTLWENKQTLGYSIVPCSAWPQGVYMLDVNNENSKQHIRLMKMD